MPVPDEAPLKYTKQEGTNIEHGFLYEKWVALFIFLRCINETMKFRLASNDDDAGAFDNVVVKCESKEPGTGRTYFIQIKHRVPTKANYS
jgi:chloramphenicol O-acetyltransferase